MENTKLSHIVLAAFGLATLVSPSCSDDDLRTKPAGEHTIYACMEADEPMSRSVIDPSEYIGGNIGLLWSPTDTIGVFGSTAKNVAFTNKSDRFQGRTAFSGLCSDPQYAYYPYSANAGSDATALRGTLAAVQSYSAATRDISGDYKVGAPRAGAPDEFDFVHIFSLLRFNVDVTGTAFTEEKLKSITVELPADRKIAGDFTFNAVDGTYSFTGNTTNTVQLKWTDRPLMYSGTSYQAYMSCAPDIRSNDDVKISILTSKHLVSFDAKIAYDFKPNNVYTFDLTLKNYDGRLVVTEAPAEPEFLTFGFEVASNQGKILDKKVVSDKNVPNEEDVVGQYLTVDAEKKTVEGMIPYLYDFSLVPTFTVPQGVSVTVNDVAQESGVTAQDFSQPIVYTLSTADGNSVDYTVSVSNTGLPVMVIEQSSTLTDGSWKQWFGGLSLRSKDSKWAEDDYIAVYDVNGKYTMQRQAAGIRLRGNTTQDYPKKPIAIKLVKKAAIGDMPKHKRWVLLANWLDCSMMRNNTAFAIAHATESAWRSGAIEQGILWNSHGTNVELVVNGRHVGNYYLCEQIKIDANRLAIKDNYEDVAKDGLVTPSFENCGYLMESDDLYDETYKFITSSRRIPFMLKDDVISEDIFNAVKAKVERIESNLKNGKYTEAYADLDINSVIDQWIVWELTMNDEYRHPKSVYTYMDGGNAKLCAGPVWDFDWQTFPNIDNIRKLNSSLGGTDYEPRSMSEWMYKNSKFRTFAFGSTPSGDDISYMWYPVLFKDANFRAAVQKRWAAIKPYLDNIPAIIAERGNANAVSWTVNREMWPTDYNRSAIGNSNCFNGDEGFATYAEVVQNLIDMYQQRLDWMNNAITNGNFITNAK